MSITIKIKNHYGQRFIYPVCNTAKIFAVIAGTKTLTDWTLRAIKDLGYEVNIEQQTLST